MQPSGQPTTIPSVQPSMKPTCQPSGHPTMQPSSQPTGIPSLQPTNYPTAAPSNQPSSEPSSPTSQPSSAPSDYVNVTLTIKVKFDGSILLNELNATELKKSPESQNKFKDAIIRESGVYESIMNEGSVDRVTVNLTAIEDESSSRRRLQVVVSSTLQTRVGFNILLEIKSAADGLGETSHTDFSNNLAASIVTGSFDAFLSQAPFFSNATALAVTVDPPTVDLPENLRTPAPTTEPTREPYELTTLAIVLIVSACLIIVLLPLGFLMGQHNKEKRQIHVSSMVETFTDTGRPKPGYHRSKKTWDISGDEDDDDSDKMVVDMLYGTAYAPLSSPSQPKGRTTAYVDGIDSPVGTPPRDKESIEIFSPKNEGAVKSSNVAISPKNAQDLDLESVGSLESSYKIDTDPPVDQVQNQEQGEGINSVSSIPDVEADRKSVSSESISSGSDDDDESDGDIAISISSDDPDE